MVCVPTPPSVTPVKLAAPEFRDTGLPLFRLTMVEPKVSVKVTEPVGVVPLFVVSDTDTETVMGLPTATELGLPETVVEVTSGEAGGLTTSVTDDVAVPG